MEQLVAPAIRDAAAAQHVDKFAVSPGCVRLRQSALGETAALVAVVGAGKAVTAGYVNSKGRECSHSGGLSENFLMQRPNRLAQRMPRLLGCSKSQIADGGLTTSHDVGDFHLRHTVARDDLSENLLPISFFSHGLNNNGNPL